MLSLKLADREITTELPAFIMGIINVTGDSFWSGSNDSASSVDRAVDNALRMIQEGADIIDIGGESTRPGSAYVSSEEEMKRVIPVLRELRKHTSCPVSIDTRKSPVMKVALEEGADILNDVSAMEDDPALVPLAASSKIPVILMHKRGIPVSMQNDTSYSDVVREVAGYLAERSVFAWKSGISPDRIILDYGAGFGKNLEGNLALIKSGRFISKTAGEALENAGAGTWNLPVLAGLSRKSFIGQITGRSVEERLSGTITAHLMAVEHGATIIRVHDVAAARDSLAVYRSLS